MKLDLYTYCYNDEDFMPFFLDYYCPIVDRITIVDNGSTDRTLDIIREYAKAGDPIIKIVHSGMKTWDWDLGLVYRNNIWKKSKYDILMWADLDEIIYHPTIDLRKFLYNNHYDIYQTKGYDMVSNTYPKRGTSILNIKMGSPAPMEDKYLIWRRGSNIKYSSAHSIEKTSEKVCRGELLLLHYKYLGVNAMVKRAEAIKSRVPPDSYCKGIGGNILKIYPSFVRTRQEYISEIAWRVSTAQKVI